MPHSCAVLPPATSCRPTPRGRGRRAFVASLLAATLPVAATAQTTLPPDVEVVVEGDQAFLVRDGQPWRPAPAAGGEQRGVPPSEYVVELAVVADKAFADRYGDAAEAKVCELVQRTQLLLNRSATTDFRIVHNSTAIHAAGDPYTVTPVDGEVDPGDLLSEFTDWEGANIATPHDAAMLLTGLDLTGSTTGLAFTGSICTAFANGVVQVGNSAPLAVTTMAHELGHNMGICHDPPAFRGFCSPLTIPDAETVCADFIMAAVANEMSPAEEFSQCSAADFEDFLGYSFVTCLDPPVVEAPVDCSAFVCPEEPRLDCAAAELGSIKVQNDGNPAKSQVKWKWKKGEEVVLDDFGDPSSTSDYRLCLYDGIGGSPVGAGMSRVTPGAAWATKGDKGWQFKSKPDVAPDGVTKVKLQPGPAGKSQVHVQAKGVNLYPPLSTGGASYFEMAPTLQVQLLASDGSCWGSTFDSADVKKNEATRFQAVAK